jgi:hypothetical protein
MQAKPLSLRRVTQTEARRDAVDVRFQLTFLARELSGVARLSGAASRLVAEERSTLLAVQLNMLIPPIQETRFRADSLPCNWSMRPGPEEPEGGYPEFMYKAGTIIGEGPMSPELSDEDQQAIDAIQSKYVDEVRREPGA